MHTSQKTNVVQGLLHQTYFPMALVYVLEKHVSMNGQIRYELGEVVILLPTMAGYQIPTAICHVAVKDRDNKSS